MDFLNLAFTFPTAIFTALLLVVILFWLITLVGFADIDMFESDIDADAAQTSSMSSWFNLGFGGVPITVSLSLIVMTCWLISIYAHKLFAYLLGDGILFYLFGMLMLLASLLVALPLAAIITKPLQRFFTSAETSKSTDLIGVECIVVTGKVTSTFGQARVQFQGVEQLIQVRSNDNEQFSSGDTAVLLERKDKGGLICKDNIRADIAITFYIRVNENKEDILRVAKHVGCARASEHDTLQELFEAKFSEALKTVGKRMDFVELFTHRNEFRDNIKEVIGQDLSGYTLEDVAIDYLEQTSIDKLDSQNILDAEGIRRITEMTALQNVSTNQLKCDERAKIEIQNQEATEKTLEIERQKQDAMSRQVREIETVKAREFAEAEKVRQEERLKSEQARLQADEAIGIAEQNKQRELDIAEQNRLRVLGIEEEKVSRSREIEVIERERETEILRINKEKALEVKRKEIADVVRDRVIVEKSVAEEEERIKDVKVLAGAEREKEAVIIRAKAEAEEALVKDIEAAKAQEQAAEYKARELETMANAELRIANQQAESKKILAQAQQVETAAKGLAEADVIKAKAEANAIQGETDARVLQQKLQAQAQGDREIGLTQAQVQTAMADANEKQGEVEAINLERKMLAEAKGLEEKLQALNAMDQDARDYESFTLQLNQQKELVLAKISASKDIAEHQSHIMAKALGDADINIMGGDGQFFNQFMSAISLGKSIDGLVDESQTVQTVFKDHLNGDRNLIEDLKGVLAGANGSAETLKNFNMSKLLKQLSNTTAAEKSQLLSMLGGNLGSGLDDKIKLDPKD